MYLCTERVYNYKLMIILTVQSIKQLECKVIFWHVHNKYQSILKHI